MTDSFAKKLDDLPLLEVPLAVSGIVAWFGLPGDPIDRAWWVLPLAVAALFAALYPKARNARAGTFAVAGGLALFGGVHALNRLAERKPAAVEMMEVVQVEEPNGKDSGHTLFRRPGQSDLLYLGNGWHSKLGKPLPLVFHECALGLRWVEEPRR
jgi:hypothetical protein